MSISGMDSQIDALFAALEKKGCRNICLTADIAKAGTTSVCMALYERYLLAGYKTLYVDLALLNPSFKASELLTDLVEHKTEKKIFSGIAAPLCQSEQYFYRDPNALKKHLLSWHQQYQRVVFDTSNLNAINQKTIPATLIAAVCDAAILVVKAGESTSEHLEQMLTQLEKTDCPFVAIVLNQYQLNTFAEAILSSKLCSFWLPKNIKKNIKKTMQKYPLFNHVI